MATSTVEDYLKATFLLQQDSPNNEATVAGLAATLGVTKGSVTSMVRKLREAGFVDSERYGGIRTTRKGRGLALDMIRRHRLIEVFLVERLGLDWSEVHEEAERLEHAISAKVLERLDEYLGKPEFDPHGDPIPDAKGRLVKTSGSPLSALSAGDRATVARVIDQEPAFLEFAARHGLRPGAPVQVIDVVREAQSVTVQAGSGTPVSMSTRVAEKILVDS